MNITIREKDGGFQAILSYKQAGKWKQKSKQGFDKRKDAKLWAEEVAFTIKEDEKDNITTSDMTIKEALDIYLNYKKNSVKFSTYKQINSNLKIIIPFYDFEIKKIKPFTLSNYFQELQKSGKIYMKTQQNVKEFFNFCIKELKIIRENPLIIQKKEREDKRIKYISKELYLKILNEQTREDFKLFIEIAYNTGMRYGEILGLKQEDIKDCVITVKRQKYRKEITTLKTKNSYREIPIPCSLYKKIKNYKIAYSDGCIFKGIFDPRILKKYNTSPHCFRHTFATNLVAKGINLKVASEILGDNFATFINTYVQPSQEEKEKVFKLLTNF